MNLKFLGVAGAAVLALAVGESASAKANTTFVLGAATPSAVVSTALPTQTTVLTATTATTSLISATPATTTVTTTSTITTNAAASAESASVSSTVAGFDRTQ